MTNLYGLIGKKLSHSFSPDYFEKKFEAQRVDAEYRLFEWDEITQLPEFIKKYPNLMGLNITIPYKKEVLLYLDELDEVAKQTASVNTVQIRRKKGSVFLKGFNTDVIGFEQTLLPLIANRKGMKALVLGTGGSAQAVAFVLESLGIEFVFVSRKPVHTEQLSYAEITKKSMQKYRLIINTTPLGMFPLSADAPSIPYTFITSKHILFDLIYNPPESLFLKHGRLNGAAVSNGLRMLEIQADAAWEIWHR
ncbi:MAG: shikimate dehydrogenase [Bacteroidales bacterium]|nr:shikimate dehydrogenase [Bacteroidales bacterium]